MKHKRTTWRRAAIIILAASNLLLANEIRTVKRDTINEIYFNQVKSGFYNESNSDVARNPMTGQLESNTN